MGDHTADRARARFPVAGAVSLIIGISCAVTACAASADDPSMELPSSAAVQSGPLLSGMTVSVYQSRSDVASGRLEVQIANLSDTDVTITAVEFSAPQFAAAVVWRKDSTVIESGRTLDLPVALAAAVCAEGPPAPTVRLAWTADGETHSSDVVPTDERGRLEELRTAGCVAEAVGSIATLTLETPPRPLTVAGVAAADLDITVAPGTAAGGELVLRSVSGTTLFTFIDPVTGSQTTSLDLDTIIEGGEESVVTVTLVPTRCDPHAVAEDKQGTIFVFEVEVTPSEGPPLSGMVSIAASAELKPQLIAFIGEACGATG